jgi:hypothetical protein
MAWQWWTFAGGTHDYALAGELGRQQDYLIHTRNLSILVAQ